MTERDDMEIPEAWTFHSANVADAFDRHVREQLPWYEHATRAVAFLARYYTPRGGAVYDLGCSTGNIGRAIEPTLTERAAEFYPVDNSAAMLARYEAPGDPITADLERFTPRPHDLAIAFLTYQFVRPAERRAAIKRVLERQREGGALILVDKFLPDGRDADADAAIYRLTLEGKRAAGANPADVMAKELSLTGAQRPLRELRDFPPSATVTQFFAVGQFRGYILAR